MKNAFSSLSLSLGFGILAIGFTSPAHAYDKTNGFLTDYQYQVSNVTLDEAKELMNQDERRDTANNSICINRAEIWSYTMNRNHHIQAGKVFIHFTAEGLAKEDKSWAFHVAPYVIVDGKEMVLDNAFGDFNHAPVSLEAWTKHFGQSENCAVLNPSKESSDLDLELNNLGGASPTDFRRGRAVQYPSTKATCYIRKTPMYYVSPADVYRSDLGLNGQEAFSKYVFHAFDPKDVMVSCRQALSLFTRFSQSCSEYLGIDE